MIPADAEVPSHKLLIRAGYIRPVAPGLYSWLPLGLRVLRNIERVVREEMNAIGGQEILFPALLPRAPCETTNRWTEYGDSMFRLKDRRGNDYLLGPTHEELFTLTVKGEYSSYKDFPLLLFPDPEQIPRRGAAARGQILRVREFVMKDSYSFDVDDASSKPPTTRTGRPISASSQSSRCATSSSRPCRGRWAAAPRRSSWPKARWVRTPSCAAWSRVMRPTSRPSSPPAPRRSPSMGCPRRWSTTPVTPRRSPPWWTGPTQPASAARSRPPTR